MKLRLTLECDEFNANHLDQSECKHHFLHEDVQGWQELWMSYVAMNKCLRLSREIQ